jgi:molybdenum cofactor cytidylyltransferase
MEQPDHVAAVILAAGESRRFGSPKQLAELNGRPLLQHVVAAARQAALDPIIAVVPPDLPFDGADVVCVSNPRPDLGMSHSLRLGFAAIPAGADAAMILLGDQPTVHRGLLSQLLGARGATPFVAIRAGDLLLPPVVVERSHFDVVRKPSGDIGLREVLRAQGALVTGIDVSILPVDIDTVRDLRAASGR